MLNKTESKSDTIHLRIDPHSKDLIDQAAHIMGKTRSSFMIESASEIAERVLLGQTVFKLASEKWEDFNQDLNKNPSQNKRLRKLLAQKAPWE